VTPGVAPENKLVNRLVNEGESSDEPTLEASEQPDSSAALTTSTAAPHRPRVCSRSFPRPIEFTQLFDKTRLFEAYINQFMAAPRPTERG
jgi:hypothetical protein